MSRRTLNLFFVLILIAGGGLFAQQNAQELRIGTIVTGNLTTGGEIWYRIRTTDNFILTIETLGTTDTYLELYDAQQNLISKNDDGGSNSNAKIELLVPRGGNYLVKLRGFEDASGPFRIIADSSPLPNAVDLTSGAVLSGSLATGQRQLYRVRSTGAGIFTVETSGSMDTYLEVYDSSYKLIGSDDDGGDGENSRYELYAENNQTYYVLLRGYGDSSGSYRIFASFESMTAVTSTNISRSTAATLSLGEAITVFFTRGQSRWFVYQVTRTGIVTFVVQTRGNIDTLLLLYDNQGNLIEEDDDSGDGENARITTRLNAGTYYIEAKEYSGGSGRCTISAEIR